MGLGVGFGVGALPRRVRTIVLPETDASYWFDLAPTSTTTGLRPRTELALRATMLVPVAAPSF